MRSGVSASGTSPARRRPQQRPQSPPSVLVSRAPAGRSPSTTTATWRSRSRDSLPTESKSASGTAAGQGLRPHGPRRPRARAAASTAGATRQPDPEPPTNGEMLAASIAASMDGVHSGATGGNAGNAGVGVSGFTTSSIIAAPLPSRGIAARNAPPVVTPKGRESSPGRPMAGRVARPETALPKQHRPRRDAAAAGPGGGGAEAAWEPATVAQPLRQGRSGPLGHSGLRMACLDNRSRDDGATRQSSPPSGAMGARGRSGSDAPWLADYHDGVASVASLYEVAATLPASQLPSSVIASTLEMRLRLNGQAGAATMAEEARGMRSRRQAGGRQGHTSPRATSSASAGAAPASAKLGTGAPRAGAVGGGQLPPGVRFEMPQPSDLAAPARLKPALGARGAAIGRASRFGAIRRAPRRSAHSASAAAGVASSSGPSGLGGSAAGSGDPRAALRQRLVAGTGAGLHALLLEEDGPSSSVRQAVARERLAAGAGGMLGRSQLAEAALSAPGPGPGDYYKPQDYLKQSFRRSPAPGRPGSMTAGGRGGGVASGAQTLPARSAAASRTRTALGSTRSSMPSSGPASQSLTSPIRHHSAAAPTPAGARRSITSASSKWRVCGAYKLSRPARPYLPSLGIETEMDGLLQTVRGHD